LYEGGIRAPFIVRWDGHIPAGKVDTTTVLSGIDLFPSCCSIAHVPLPNAKLDGEDLSQAFLGTPVKRRHNLFWDYGRLANMQRPGLKDDQSPNLAVRSEDWKLLINDDGSNLELYDFRESDKERNNVASQNPNVAKRLSTELLTWRKLLPVWES
jgi:arylsulfatase A-like enzyme